MLGAIDALDQKLAQTISINGLILSFIFDKGTAASSVFLFYTGLILIILGMFFCAYAFRAQKFKDSPNPNLYLDKAEKEICKELRKLWVKAIEHNINAQGKKANYLNVGLVFTITGLTAIIVGYYV